MSKIKKYTTLDDSNLDKWARQHNEEFRITKYYTENTSQIEQPPAILLVKHDQWFSQKNDKVLILDKVC